MKSVFYLVADSAHLSDEEQAGWKFLKRNRGFIARKISFPRLARNPETLKGNSVLWWHFDSSVNLPPSALDPSVVSSIRDFVKRGGSLLLTLLSAQYIVDLGVEEARPNVVEKGEWNRTCWAEKYPDIRGLSSFRGHPIFDGLHGAAYTWSPSP